MEFRKCPACEASVLDDDAADCPFCGASMSGKPTSGKSTASTTKPAKAAPKPAEKSAVAKPTGKAPGSPAVKAPSSAAAASGAASAGKQLAKRSAVADRPQADDADPFDVDTSVIAQAPPMAPRPAKGRMIRVVCPMCETPGFISANMQGRDVKCCNPQCLVPVFKAPRPEQKAEPEAQPRSFLSTKTIMLGCAIILPLAAIIAMLVLGNRGPEPYKPKERSPLGATDPAKEPSHEEAAQPAKAQAVKPKATLAQIQQQALQLSIDAARERGDNRSKPYCRRLTAEAFAQVGNLKEARTQLIRLQGVTPEPFYRIEPLVEIAWQQLAQGDRGGADQTLNEAFEAAQDFPPVGRPAATAAASLAAALAAVDRFDDAHEVLRRLGRTDERAISRERVAALVQITKDLAIFDLDRVLRFTSLEMASEPLAVAATVSLAAHQQWDPAVAWALAVKDIAAREDCMAALALVAARQAAIEGEDAPVTAVIQAGNKLSTTGQCRVAAGVATGSLMHNEHETEAATAALQKALALLETLTPSEAMARPTVKLIHDSADQPNNGLPDRTSEFRSAAEAAAQLARLHHLLGDKEAAWAMLLRAWEFTKGLGPELAATSAFVDEIAKNAAAAEQRLRRDMGIANRDLGERAFRRYRQQAKIWGAAAELRFDLEVALLEEALNWGLLDNVAQVVADPAAVIPSAVGQPYASSYLPGMLKVRYEAAGNQAKASEMAALESGSEEMSHRIAQLVARSELLFQQKKDVDAATLLGDFRGPHHYAEHLRDQRGIELACRMVKLRNPDKYFPFLLALRDPVLVEDALEMTAALAVREGMAPDLWERYRLKGLTATQRVAFFRGLTAGIVAVGADPPTAGTKTAAAPKP